MKKISVKEALKFFDKYHCDDPLEGPEIKKPRWHVDARTVTNMATGSNKEASLSKRKSQKSLGIMPDAKENIDLTGEDEDDDDCDWWNASENHPKTRGIGCTESTTRAQPPQSSSTPLDHNDYTSKKRNNFDRISTNLYLSRRGSTTSKSTSRFDRFRNTGLNKSIRLEDKRNYLMLLQSCIGSDFIIPTPALKIDDSSGVPEIKNPRGHVDPRTFTNMAAGSNMEASLSEWNTQKSLGIMLDAKENIDLTGEDEDDDDVQVVSDVSKLTGCRAPFTPLSAGCTESTTRVQHPQFSSTPFDHTDDPNKKRNNFDRISTNLCLSRIESSTSRNTSQFDRFRNTGLNKLMQVEDKRKPSTLLHTCISDDILPPASSSLQGSHQLTQLRPTSVKFMKKSPSLIEVVDLTKGDSMHIPVVRPKQCGAATMSEPSRFKAINSYEEKLKSTGFIGAEWIEELKKKYEEKVREKRRTIKEADIVKNLYKKPNVDEFHNILCEKIQQHLVITEAVLEEREKEVALPELTPDMKAKVRSAFVHHPPGQVLVEGFGQQITRRDIQTLNKLNWLNDEVINFYMNLLIERGKNDNLPSIYAFNTFFFPKVVSVGQSAVKRWTKKVDIFAMDMIVVPVHLGVHWCLSTIDFRDKTIRYYDSMGGSNNRCLNALLKYLEHESLDKKKQPFDTSDWKLENVQDIPHQMNGSDCGMFSCMFAEFLSRNAKLTFSQEQMPYFREKMTYEILTKKLLT